MNASYSSCASLHGGIDQYDRKIRFYNQSLINDAPQGLEMEGHQN